MNACTNGNEPVLFSLAFIIRAISGLFDIIVCMQTDIEKKSMIKQEREGLVRYAGFVCHILVYNIEQ
jgi:hypothetical protein